MVSSAHLLGFALASLVLIVIPGPGVLFIVGRDLAPLCRHHHRCKQAEGWSLDQPQPGVLVWRTPSGRRYATRPTQYPV
jgi:hypothetical protein